MYLTDSTGNTLTGIYMHDNKYAAVYFDSSDSNTLDANNIDENCGGESGVYVYGSEDVVISDNNITRGTGYGIEVLDSSIVQITDNNINNNTNSGIYVTSDSHVDLTNSHFIGNGGYGIYDEAAGESVYWTITEDITCTDNDITIYGWIVPVGGAKFIADNCEIYVYGEESWDEEEFDLENDQNGYIEFAFDPGDTVGGEEYGFEATVYTDGDDILKVEFFADNPGGSGFALEEFGKYVDLNIDEDNDVDSWLLKIFYTDAELAASGLDESKLRIEYYNESSDTWTKYDSPVGGVNTDENYVWANITHFSLFGVFGSEPVNNNPGGGGGGGGGGSYEPPCVPSWECDEWNTCTANRQTRTCSDVNSCDTDESKPKTSQVCVPADWEPQYASTEEPEEGEDGSNNTGLSQGSGEPEEEEKSGNQLTGMAVADNEGGSDSTGGYWAVGIGLFALILLLLLAFLRKHRN